MKPPLFPYTTLFRSGTAVLAASAPGANELREVVGAELGDPLLGPIVDVHDSEPFPVAPRPLEVVQQRPCEVAAHVGAFRDRVGDGADMGFERGPPIVVLHPTVGNYVVVRSEER